MMRNSSVHIRFHRDDIVNYEVLFWLRNVVIGISIALSLDFSDILSSKEAVHAR